MYAILICSVCHSNKFRTYKYKCNLNDLEIIASIYKCLICGKEYIDKSIPEKIRKFIIEEKTKEKTKEILSFLSTHTLTGFIKDIRINKELSQNEVGKRAGVKFQRIYSIENEPVKIKIETAYRLAIALECKDIARLWRYEPLESKNMIYFLGETFIPKQFQKKLLQNTSKEEKTNEILNFFNNYEIKCFLKNVRLKKGLSQKEVGKRVGVKPQRIYSFENKPFNVRLETAYKLGIALECEDISELWRYESKESSNTKIPIITRGKCKK